MSLVHRSLENVKNYLKKGFTSTELEPLVNPWSCHLSVLGCLSQQ